jgi:hypothetical protein
VLIDRDGKIAYSKAGLYENELETNIANIL